MTFIELIVHLVGQRPIELLYREHGVTVYLSEVLAVDADVALLGLDKTDGDIRYVQDGVPWLYCLELDLVEEMVADGVADGMSPAAKER